MARSQLAVVGKKQFVEVTTVLADATQRAKLQNYIDEVVRCKAKILDENETIKALRESAVEELNIEPKMFNALVSTFFNNNFQQKRDEHQQILDAIDAIMSSVDSKS